MLSSDLLSDGAARAEMSDVLKDRSVRRQVGVLVSKQLAMKARNWRWTLLEWVFPLQGVVFLYFIFRLGSFLIFEKIETQAQNFAPENLLNSSAPGLLGLMHVGGSVGFAPTVSSSQDLSRLTADKAAAQAVYSMFCGAYEAMLASSEYQQVVRAVAEQSAGDASACFKNPSSMECKAAGLIGRLGDTTPGECLWLDDVETMVERGGWLPVIDTTVRAGSDPGLYLGVEVGKTMMKIRYEEMLLAENANADPREKNAARSGLLAIQATVSSLLILHSKCPAEMEACDRTCVTSAVGTAIGLIADFRKCAESPSVISCTQTCGLAACSLLSAASLSVDCTNDPLSEACFPAFLAYFRQATSSGSTSVPPQAMQLGACLGENPLDVDFALLDPSNLFIERFPIRARTEMINLRKYLYPANFVPILVLTCQGTLTLLGEEKERGIKDALLLKGMSRVSYYLAWFLSQSLGMTVSVVAVTLGAKIIGVIEITGMMHFGFLAFAFGCWFITLAFLICASLKTTKSMFVAGIIMLIIIIYTAYLPEILMIGPGESGVPSAYWKVLLLFLFPPVPYGHLLWILSDGELAGTGLTEGLTKVSWPTATHDYYYEAHIFMVMDIFLYLGLAWLLDYVKTDPLALRRPVTTSGESTDLELTSTANGVGISIRGLSKRFSWTEKDGFRRIHRSVQAVDNLDLEVSKHSIFCLLGHNGAGKTTTGALLTGLLAPDSGTATVGGFDIVQNRSEMRQSLGMCPQHDILYDGLTALEHLQLFGSIIGLTDEHVAMEASRLLKAVGLQAKANDLAKQMSGGQQRRLSLASSLIGTPAVAFLDEPSTGLDPHNRQKIWELMQEVKCSSTVLLTTHAMEEADMLGDEIGIMAKGKLQAFGTALQLKHDHGSGYSLSVVKVTADAPTDPVKSCIFGIVAQAVLRTDSGHELTFSLPIDSVAAFPQLFRHLKERSEVLGIATFGLAQGTLEDVFLRLTDDENDDEEEDGDVQQQVESATHDTPIPSFECAPSFRLQLEAVMQQFWINATRSKVAILHGVVQPLGLVYLGSLFVPLVQQSFKPMPNLLQCHGQEPCAGNMSLAGLGEIQPHTATCHDRDCVFPSCDALVNSFCPHEFDDGVSTVGQQSNCETTVAFCHLNEVDATDVGWSGIPVGATSLLYSDDLYSSRRGLACYYNAVFQSTNRGALETSYQSFPEKLGTNQIAGGALMGFISNVFMIQTVFYCEEMMRLRVERIKEMLLLTGVPRRSFWAAYFLSHLGFFSVAWTIAYMCMLWSGMKGVSTNSVVAYFALALSAGPTFIVYGYLLSFGVNTFVQCHQWVGNWLNVTYAIAWMILTFGVEPGSNVAQQMETAFCLMPSFAFYQGIAKLEVAAVNGVPLEGAFDVFDYDRGVLRSILFLMFDFLLFTALIYIIDTNFFSRIRGPQTGSEVGIDEDQRHLQDILPPVQGATADDRQNNVATAVDLSKRYPLQGGGSVQAVRHTSIGVPPNSILGLLGPNGAGKTTLVEMLAGLEEPDSGNAWIEQRSIVTDLDSARRKLGLCPQFDALLPNLTAREHLIMFSKVRGVPPEMRTRIVNRTIRDMGLSLKADCRVHTYSGGNKRKLSVALSMVSDPAVSFLDEPSTGMDPKARRAMWDYLINLKSGSFSKQQRGIILTTHSMEEADALSDRIAIMVRGELRALGPSQTLKSMYGAGFLVTVRILASGLDADSAFTRVSEALGTLSESVKEEPSSTMVKRFELPSADADLASIFELLNQRADELHVVDFSVTQTTLEDVFLRFARLQRDDHAIENLVMQPATCVDRIRRAVAER